MSPWARTRAAVKRTALQPRVQATNSELQAIGVTEPPGVAVADSGYLNEEQIDNVVANEHEQVPISPDASACETRASPLACVGIGGVLYQHGGTVTGGG